MRTLREALTISENILKEAGIAEYKEDAKYILEQGLGIESRDYLLNMNNAMTEADLSKYDKLIQIRATGKPCQYIFNETEFMGLSFYVDERVLIPRGDTELLVDEALAYLLSIENPKAIDVCTGSGCIILSLASYCHGLEAMGIDISEDALEVAKINRERLEVAVSFELGDLLEGRQEKVHLITANPPYITKEELKELDSSILKYEPHLALDGGEDGLIYYRKLIPMAYERLLENGLLMVEIGYQQGEAVKKIFEEAGFDSVKCIRDYQGYDRIVKGYKV